MAKKCLILSFLFLFLIMNLILQASIFTKAEDISLTYSGHIQDIGWTNKLNADAICGTTNRSLRLEAIIINLSGDDLSSVEYSTHIQDTGWSDYVSNGEISGTTGENKRIEAIRIRLNGPVSNNYDIYYRTHIEGYGWQDWVKNDEISGTTGESRRIEAFQIQIVSKSLTKDSTTNGYPSNSGALQVIGNQLSNQNGSSVQLKGVSLNSDNSKENYINQTLFHELKSNWNLNSIRIPVDPVHFSKASEEEINNIYSYIKNGISYALNADLYVVIDWHIQNENPNTFTSEAIDFFTNISTEFGNYNNIIYEISNEPGNEVIWQEIKRYSETIIPVIRSNDPDAVIIVGSPNNSRNIKDVYESPLTVSNIMYSFHFNAATDTQDLKNSLLEVIRNGLPVIVSEFRISDTNTIDQNSGNQWMSLLNNFNISYFCWNFSNNSEPSALIKDNITNTNGFTTSNLTQKGLWFLTILKSRNSNISKANNILDYQLTLIDNWTTGSKYFYKYEIEITNNSNISVNDWQIVLEANQNIKLENSWNARYKIKDNLIIISGLDYNKNLLPNSSFSDSGFIVEVETPLILE